MKEKEQKAVKINDGRGTVIFVDADEDSEKAIEKYLKAIQQSQSMSINHFNKGNESPARHK